MLFLCWTIHCRNCESWVVLLSTPHTGSIHVPDLSWAPCHPQEGWQGGLSPTAGRGTQQASDPVLGRRSLPGPPPPSFCFEEHNPRQKPNKKKPLGIINGRGSFWNKNYSFHKTINGLKINQVIKEHVFDFLLKLHTGPPFSFERYKTQSLQQTTFLCSPLGLHILQCNLQTRLSVNSEVPMDTCMCHLVIFQ